MQLISHSMWIVFERRAYRMLDSDNSAKKNIAPVSQKILTQQLRELEADGIISRELYPEVPPRAEYSLTARGMTLKPDKTLEHT